MATEDKDKDRTSRIATVVATAAVTLALGVTAAGLGGYLGRAQEASPAPKLVPARAEAPAVVLVPMSPAPPPAQAVPQTVFAAYEPAEHDDDRHRVRGHHEREREHDDD